jgi:hypothetical protein
VPGHLVVPQYDTNKMAKLREPELDPLLRGDTLRPRNVRNALSRDAQRRNMSLNKTIAARRDVITVQATRR